MGKKAQVTIFIILAIVIVISISLFFVIRETDILQDMTSGSSTPREFIQTCIEDYVEDSVDAILENGLAPTPGLTTMYNGSEVTYLCYQADNYLSCYNLYPMLEDKIESKITEDISSGVEICFEALAENFESKNYDISLSEPSYSVDIQPSQISIKITNPIEVSKGDFSESFENFDTKVISPIYDFTQVARQIVNSESSLCYFEYNGYALLYPQYRISVAIRSDDSKIYSIRDIVTNKEFKFAVRGCAIPSGIF